MEFSRSPIMERTCSLYMLSPRGIASDPIAGTGAVSTKGTKPSRIGISSLHSFLFSPVFRDKLNSTWNSFCCSHSLGFGNNHLNSIANDVRSNPTATARGYLTPAPLGRGSPTDCYQSLRQETYSTAGIQGKATRRPPHVSPRK